VASDEAGRTLIERVLAQPVADAAQAACGFTNRTALVTLAAATAWSCSGTAAARTPRTGWA
jgi:hypothetical protein